MRSVLVAGSLVVVAAACGSDRGNGVTYPAARVATISVSVASTVPMTSAGDRQLVTAVAKDVNGSVISAPDLSWQTSAPSVATVEGSGETATITAVDDGTAVITAAVGGAQGTATVAVHRKVVALEVSGPDSVVAGSTTQLEVIGRDVRQKPVTGLSGVTFATSNPFNVAVSPTGLATALFSSFRPFDSIITATLTRDGVTLNATKRIEVTSAAPSSFDFIARMGPESVRPEPVNSAGDGIIFLTLDGARVHYTILWSLLGSAPTSAHIHGPDGSDAVADVLVDLPLGSQPATNGVMRGSFSSADIHPQNGRPAISLDSLVTLMRSITQTYVDVHTGQLTDGEIRGLVFKNP